jgi:hypothetical protein
MNIFQRNFAAHLDFVTGNFSLKLLHLQLINIFKMQVNEMK